MLPALAAGELVMYYNKCFFSSSPSLSFFQRASTAGSVEVDGCFARRALSSGRFSSYDSSRKAALLTYSEWSCSKAVPPIPLCISAARLTRLPVFSPPPPSLPPSSSSSPSLQKAEIKVRLCKHSTRMEGLLRRIKLNVKHLVNRQTQGPPCKAIISVPSCNRSVRTVPACSALFKCRWAYPPSPTY